MDLVWLFQSQCDHCVHTCTNKPEFIWTGLNSVVMATRKTWIFVSSTWTDPDFFFFSQTRQTILNCTDRKLEDSLDKWEPAVRTKSDWKWALVTVISSQDNAESTLLPNDSSEQERKTWTELAGRTEKHANKHVQIQSEQLKGDIKKKKKAALKEAGV